MKTPEKKEKERGKNVQKPLKRNPDILRKRLKSLSKLLKGEVKAGEICKAFEKEPRQIPKVARKPK